MINSERLIRLQKSYWNFSNLLSKIYHMFKRPNRPFGYEVMISHFKHLSGRFTPVKENSRQAADAAVSWLIRAQGATPDHGVSHGYFPCHWDFGWRPSYPETTGYIIPSMLEYARRNNKPHIRDYAISMARWECDIQMESGAVQGGPVCPPSEQKAAIFNTGMVLQGWTAAFRETNDVRFFDAGHKAADFLVSDLDGSGHFQSHGGFVAQDRIKTYNVLCSWALYRFGEDSGDLTYRNAALRNGEATLLMQHENGWFESCCLTHPETPLTHTLGYTLQGLLELGILAGREDFISAVEKGVDPLIRNIHQNGYLAGRFDRVWKPRARYSCLTGSAQIAIVLYRLAQVKGHARYTEAADRLVNYLKSIQANTCSNKNVNGAIPGSYPILGAYMTAGYPNWATKYFLDALLLQEEFEIKKQTQ